MAEKQLTPVERRRQVALAAMDRFADEHGASGRNWDEVDEGDRMTLVGYADNGRRFYQSYQKETERERYDHG